MMHVAAGEQPKPARGPMVSVDRKRHTEFRAVNITVLLFATLRQQAGWKERVFAVAPGATVRDLVAAVDVAQPELNLAHRTCYVAVNEEYVKDDRTLQEGDRVALLPPVSGGEDRAQPLVICEITSDPLSIDDAARRVTRDDCGAVAAFSGTVRGETATGAGVQGTAYLVYEAYDEMALGVMRQIGAELIQRWPKVRAACLLHRTGRVEIGEPSVVIAVATPHRGDGCFEACAWAIDRLKAIAPIWKQENGTDGQRWVEGPRQDDLTFGLHESPPTR